MEDDAAVRRLETWEREWCSRVGYLLKQRVTPCFGRCELMARPHAGNSIALK